MEGKGFIELWDEFISLQWDGYSPNSSWNSRLEDIELFPLTYIRRWEGRWILHILPISTKLIIPAPWPQMWSEFNTWGGAALRELLSRPPNNLVEEFGLRMFGIVSHIERKMCGSEEFWEIWEKELRNLLLLGTKVFRKWMEEQYEIKLEPWIYENIEDRKEI